MADSKNKIEALLFSSGKKMAIDEISKIVKFPSKEILQQLQQLKKDYDSKESALILSEEQDGWKLTVKEQYSGVVRKIVADTELTKSLMETLAVIALKAPVLQSEVIKIRTNKAYDHLSELEKSGFIKRTKHSRTKSISLTEQFFNYFDMKNVDELKEKFKIQKTPDPKLNQPKSEEQKNLLENQEPEKTPHPSETENRDAKSQKDSKQKELPAKP